MSKRPWYKRYPSDLITGCLQLNLDESGAYSYIIDLINDKRGPIKNDPRWLGNCFGCSTRKASVLVKKLSLTRKKSDSDECFITIKDGMIYQSRAVSEVLSGIYSTDKNEIKPFKNEDKSPEKTGEDSENNDLDEKTDGKNTPHTRDQRPETRKKERKKEYCFDDFWLICPKKIARDDSEKEWDIAIKNVSPETIIDGFKAYLKNKPEYTSYLYPVTYLKKRRWTDDYGGVERTPEVQEQVTAKQELYEDANILMAVKSAKSVVEKFGGELQPLLAAAAERLGVEVSRVNEIAGELGDETGPQANTDTPQGASSGN